MRRSWFLPPLIYRKSSYFPRLSTSRQASVHSFINRLGGGLFRASSRGGFEKSGAGSISSSSLFISLLNTIFNWSTSTLVLISATPGLMSASPALISATPGLFWATPVLFSATLALS
jgi:hypothetical protein